MILDLSGDEELRADCNRVNALQRRKATKSPLPTPALLVASSAKVSPGVVIAWSSLCMDFVTTLGLPT